jgi:hypothetical protein
LRGRGARATHRNSRMGGLAGAPGGNSVCCTAHASIHASRSGSTQDWQYQRLGPPDRTDRRQYISPPQVKHGTVGVFHMPSATGPVTARKFRQLTRSRLLNHGRLQIHRGSRGHRGGAAESEDFRGEWCVVAEPGWHQTRWDHRGRHHACRSKWPRAPPGTGPSPGPGRNTSKWPSSAGAVSTAPLAPEFNGVTL